MQPGLTRAVPLAVVGFLLGALVTLVLRGLQTVEPVWDPGVAMTLAAFFAAWFFVWGMGAFDPKMSEHATGHDHPAPHPESEATPVQQLGYGIWTVTFWVLLLVVGLLLLTNLPGIPTLIISNDPNAQPSANGFQTVELFGQAVEVSQFGLFLLVTGWTLLSLALMGGVIAFVFFVLFRGVETSRAMAKAGVIDTRMPWYVGIPVRLTRFGLRIGGSISAFLLGILRPRGKQLN